MSCNTEPIIPRALVLMQPAATFAVHGVWPLLPLKFGTDYRGRLYIVAGVRWDEYNRAVCNARPYRDALLALGYNRRNPVPLGSIVGHANVEDCICDPIYESREDEETEDYRAYRFNFGGRYLRDYHWRLGGPRVIPAPIPIRGSMGLFRLTPDLAARARDAAQEPKPTPVLDAPRTVIGLGVAFMRNKR